MVGCYGNTSHLQMYQEISHNGELTEISVLKGSQTSYLRLS